MSEPLYLIPCFMTGRAVAQGTETQLREAFAAANLGEPFDERGQVRYPQPLINVQTKSAPGPKLALVNG